MPTLDDLNALRRLAELDAKANGYSPAGQPGTLQFGPFDTGVPIPASLNDSLAGTGKFFSDVGRGARQASSSMSNALGLVPDSYMADKATQDAETERLDKPLGDTLAGKVGGVTGAIATGLAVPTTTVAGGAALGAGLNALMPAEDNWDRLKNVVIGGAAGGLGQAVANGAGATWKWLRSPSASILSGDDKALVQRALDLGYKLTPDQVTGKAWQRNLQAALDTFPTTSARGQATAAANQATTNRVVDEALQSAGGAIDQPSAAAAAMAGWDKGISAQKAVNKAAYTKATEGTAVDLEHARPALEVLRTEQQALPASSRTGDAMSTLDDLLGTAEKPGYIADQGAFVPGDVAQNLRSDYSSASAGASGRDKPLFGQMKSAIDGAIEKSLPPDQQELFQAANARYGIYKAVEALEPKQQDAFLSSLYRGSKSPDLFYSFLGMAPEGQFKDVARGFLSKLVEGATKGGNVDAAALGSAASKLNPEASRFFGGVAMPMLEDVGNIGTNVLASKVPNSGTAQRLLWQGLIQAPGAIVGGYEGGKMGGVRGAVEGAGAGALAGRVVMPRLIQSAFNSPALLPWLTKEGAEYSPSLLAQALRRYGAIAAEAPTAEARR